jgi:hypothetical protein
LHVADQNSLDRPGLKKVLETIAKRNLEVGVRHFQFGVVSRKCLVQLTANGLRVSQPTFASISIVEPRDMRIHSLYLG